MKTTTIGIDLAKELFQTHGVNEHGKVVIRKCRSGRKWPNSSRNMLKASGQALLLHRAEGAPWDKDYWKKQFNKARVGARLPDGIVLYGLRHVAISNMINAGMDIHIIARLAGTSTTMTDKN